jgi:HTH-type transcriptional regulator / antitoxin HigA
MITSLERVYRSWQDAVESGIRPPQTEEEYLELRRLMDDLTSRHNIQREPWRSLFGLIADYMHAWELQHEPELKSMQVPGHEMLAFFMEQHGLKQKDLEDIIDQGNLSKILSGKRKIGAKLAKAFAARFHTDPSVFL